MLSKNWRADCIIQKRQSRNGSSTDAAMRMIRWCHFGGYCLVLSKMAVIKVGCTLVRGRLTQIQIGVP